MAHLGSASGIGSALSVSSLSMGHRGLFGDSISDTPPVTPTKMSELTPTPRSERLNSISSVQSSVQGDVFREELRFAESPRSFAAAAAATFSAAASAAGSPRMARSRLGKPPNSGLMSVDLEWELSLKDEANHSSQVRLVHFSCRFRTCTLTRTSGVHPPSSISCIESHLHDDLPLKRSVISRAHGVCRSYRLRLCTAR